MNRLHRLLCFALALLLAHAARADSVADEADYRFHRAATLYREGRVEDALGDFLFSNRLVHNKNVLFNIARCYEQLKKFNEAYRWYGEILAEPELDKIDRDTVQTALARMAPSLALLRLESDPPGATIYIGRRDLGARGRTPITLALPPGEVTAFFELDGYLPSQETLPLAVGKTLHLEQTLERILGTLSVTGEPNVFTLRADSPDAAPALHGDGTLKLAPGTHQLFVEAPGYAPQEVEARILAQGETPVHVKLARLPPPSGTLVVRASVNGALVRVDGKEVGFAPDVLDNIPVGKHELQLLADGREPLTMPVVVRENERTLVDVKLQYALPRVQAAERQLTLAQDAPSSITILTAQELRAFGYHTLAESLRSVRGLFVSDDRGYASLGVRGYSAPGTYNNRVLVLSDGHITNDLSLGQGFIGQDFDTDLSDVERIEIVRGPGSVLYGSAAFLAVVNVVHRTPAPGTHGSVGADALERSTGHAVFSAAGEDRWISLHAGASRSSGESLFYSPVTTGNATGAAREVDAEESAHADLRARLHDFSFAASINDRAKDLPTAPFDTVFGLPGTNLRDTRFFAETSWAHAWAGGAAADARVSYDGRRHGANFEYRGKDALGLPDAAGHPGTNGRIADWADAEARLRLPVLFGNHFFVGGELQDVFRVRLSSFTPASSNAGQTFAPGTRYSESIASVYAGDDLRLGERVSIDAAVRIDDHLDSFGTTANPRLALITQPYAGGTFKLMYGTAYRAPSFYERYFTNGASEVPGNRCDANGMNCVVLAPETIRTGEFEHTHRFNEAVSFLVAGYWSRIANILRLSGTGVRGQFAFGNRSTLTHSAGLEAELRWAPEPGVLLSAWYSFAHVTNDNTFIVPNVPTHSAAVRAQYPLLGEALALATEATYGSTRYTVFLDNNNLETPVGEQLYWNLGLSGQFSSGLRYSAFVYDLLDERPLLPAGLEVPFAPRAVPQTGRAVRVSVGGSF